MKNLKKTLSVLLVLVMACSLCVTAFATEATTENSTGSAATDISTEVKVGQDESQRQESLYGEVNKGNLDDEHKVDVYVSKGPTYTVKIPKVIILNGTDGAGEYAVAVKGDIEGEKQITIAPAASVTLKQAGKADITATITQADTNVVDAEMSETEYAATATLAGSILVDSDADGKSLLTAGSWTGNFLIHISYDDVVNG